MMIIELPVAPYSPPAQIREWIRELEAMRKSPDAERFDLALIEDYLVMARGWLEDAQTASATESGSGRGLSSRRTSEM